MVKIRRALISVWDKKGIVEFARILKKFNVEIISTGKTATILKKNGIAAKEVSSLTGFPEILSGRVKTLQPQIFGAILANKKNPLHLEEIKDLGIIPIDMVVVNFYPFEKMSKEKLTLDQIIEYIDIGGPSLLRAGAKNFKNVACISDISQYEKVIEDLNLNKGAVSEELRRDLACEVFRKTKSYDNDIFNYFNQRDAFAWDFEKSASLRYGENPHQKGSLYKLLGKSTCKYKQFQGKQISFNNFLDLDAAVSIVREMSDPAAVVIKHNSPCGVASDKRVEKAYVKAYKVDALSSFGGIVGLNRKVDKNAANRIIESGFRECVIAPSFSKEALKIFETKKNLRVISCDMKNSNLKDVKRTSFGYLIQENDLAQCNKRNLKVVTKKKPTATEIKDLMFALKIVKFVKSNAVVIVKNGVSIGIGGGEPSRVGAVKIAIKQAGKQVKGAVIASDAFFPKEDSIKLFKKHGIKAIIQPGGSIMDQKVIDCCDKYGIAMVFTGIRHFRH